MTTTIRPAEITGDGWDDSTELLREREELRARLLRVREIATDFALTDNEAIRDIIVLVNAALPLPRTDQTKEDR